LLAPVRGWRLFDYEDLQSFVSVADAGGITPAARRLGLAKSAVSRRLLRLEGQLGVQLLARTTRGAALTDAGMTFRDHAARVVAELDLAREAVSPDGALRGTLRVAAPLSFGPVQLAPVFAMLAIEHPRLNVHATYSDGVVDIVSEGYDAAVRIGHLADSSLVARRLGHVRAHFVASPDYVARKGRPASLNELYAHEALTLRSDPWPVTLRGKSLRVNPKSRFRSDNGMALVSAALAGVGISLLPDFLVDEHIADGRLVTFLADHTPPPTPIHVVRPPGPWAPRKVDVLVEKLVDRFARCRPGADPGS
jgi:DNA-binding transcriptional LysR family regulator